VHPVTAAPLPRPPLTLSQLVCGNVTEADQISRPDWLVGPCGRTRDSDPIEESNFQAALARLNEVDPDGTDYETLRWAHWACGWVEEIVTRPGSQAAEHAASMRAQLADYPVLDESLMSQIEAESEVADAGA